MQIRNARVDDVKEIYELLDHFADQGLLLGRSLSSLYDQLRDFLLCTEEEDGREELAEPPGRGDSQAGRPDISGGRPQLRRHGQEARDHQPGGAEPARVHR